MILHFLRARNSQTKRTMKLEIMAKGLLRLNKARYLFRSGEIKDANVQQLSHIAISSVATNAMLLASR